MADHYQYGFVTETGYILPGGNDVDDAMERAERLGYQLVFRRLGTWLPLFPDTPEQLDGPDPKRVAPQEVPRG